MVLNGYVQRASRSGIICINMSIISEFCFVLLSPLIFKGLQYLRVKTINSYHHERHLTLQSVNSLGQPHRRLPRHRERIQKIPPTYPRKGLSTVHSEKILSKYKDARKKTDLGTILRLMCWLPYLWQPLIFVFFLFKYNHFLVYHLKSLQVFWITCTLLIWYFKFLTNT